MQNVNFSLKDQSAFHIEDFPDAVAVVGPTDGYAENSKLRDLSLHRFDLSLAMDILKSLTNIEAQEIRLYLWESAVIKFTKCFGSSKSRKKMNPEEIFGTIPEAMIAYNYFKSLRDKHIAHDDNGYSHSDIGLIIAGEGKSYNIELVITPSFLAVTLSQDNFNNLNQLILAAMKFIEQEYEKTAQKITSHYEALGREVLLKFPSLKTTIKGAAEDVHLNQKK